MKYEMKMVGDGLAVMDGERDLRERTIAVFCQGNQSRHFLIPTSTFLIHTFYSLISLPRWNNYRIRLSTLDISKHNEVLKDLLKRSFDYCITEWRYE